jgi:hypothetical protein
MYWTGSRGVAVWRGSGVIKVKCTVTTRSVVVAGASGVFGGKVIGQGSSGYILYMMLPVLVVVTVVVVVMVLL